MELTKTKYKQTEVGLIPEDWEVVDIGSQCQIFGRIGFRGYTVNDIVKEDQGAITLSPSNIVNGQLDLKKVTYLSWYKYEESPEIKIFNGDILLVKTGSTYGKTALVKNLNEKATLNPQIVVLKKTKCNNAYLGYLMGFHIVQNQIEASVVGGAIPTLSQEQVSRFKIPLPPTLTEQKAIATALSDMDWLISSLEKLIAKKKAIKQGAMQELLTPPLKGGKRLPGFSGEWENKLFGEISFIKGRIGWQGLKQDEFTMNTSQPFLITGMNFKDGKIRWEEVYHVPFERYMIAKEIQLKKGDVLMTKDGTIGKLLFVDEIPSPGKATLNSHLLLFRPLYGAYVSKYLYYHLQSPDFKNHIELNKSGTTFFGISQESIEKYQLNLPPYEEQEAIAQILTDMDLEIEALEAKKTKYQGIKQGMMQELLTGKTRLV